MSACVGCGGPMPPSAPHAGQRVFCSKQCPNTIWRPGLLVITSPASGSDHPGDNASLLLIQRAPADDGWLAISQSGIVFNIFDSIARLYHASSGGRYRHLQAAAKPREWFGMRRVRLNLKPIAAK
jgi:hypothetical protein